MVAYEIEKHSRDSEAIRREGGGQHHGGVQTSGSIMESEAAQPRGDLMVPGYSGAVSDVPPPPTPYYDPDFELMFPETLQCGHSSRSVLDNCESCLACNTVYAALMKNRERVSFRNGPQARPSSADRTGDRRGTGCRCVWREERRKRARSADFQQDECSRIRKQVRYQPIGGSLMLARKGFDA